MSPMKKVAMLLRAHDEACLGYENFAFYQTMLTVCLGSGDCVVYQVVMLENLSEMSSYSGYYNYLQPCVLVVVLFWRRIDAMHVSLYEPFLIGLK
jgi:hypothetical protein